MKMIAANLGYLLSKFTHVGWVLEPIENPSLTWVELNYWYQSRYDTIKNLLQYYKTSVLHEMNLSLFKGYFPFEKKLQALQKNCAVLLNKHLIKFLSFIKSWIQTGPKYITVMQNTLSTQSSRRFL